MHKNWKHEIGKSRVMGINRKNLCFMAVAGILALWIVWISTSVLIHFIQG